MSTPGIRTRAAVRVATALATAAAALAPALTAAPAAAAYPTCQGVSVWRGVWGGDYTTIYPTTTEGSYNTSCVLGYGAESHAVWRLQSMYMECYVEDQPWLEWPAIPRDGKYGAQTAAAVRLIQANEGVRVDGIYGPQTRKNMDWENWSDTTDACFDNTYA